MLDSLDSRVSVAGKRSGRLQSYLSHVLLVLSIGAAILAGVFIIPLEPLMPEPGLDPAWMQAVNEAVARHLVFGRDVIFTYGPFASVYTCLYHPATDMLMLGGRVLVASGLVVGYLMLCWRRRVYLLLVLPLFTANVWIAYLSFDCIALALPFVFLLVIYRVTAPASHEASLRLNLPVAAGVAVLTCAVSLEPLIKGSFLLIVAMEFALAIIALILSRKFVLAAVLPALALLTMFLAWISAGQPASALFHFFVAQMPVISGYSEAMGYGIPGSSPLAKVTVVVAVVLVAIAFKKIKSTSFPWLIPSGLCLSLFLSFKVGFVRADYHIVMAAGAYFLIALAMASLLDQRTGIAITVAAYVVWLGAFGILAGIRQDAERETFALPDLERPFFRLVRGFELRRNHASGLHQLFAEANARIFAITPLQRLDGSVDLYPAELSVLFAAGDDWDPRPVFQSYSAYTSGLDSLNSAHLLTESAPNHIFFSIDPIDDRLPALDDAGSWPILLSKYQIVALKNEYLQLDRAPAALLAQKSKLLGGVTVQTGDWIDVPSTADGVWASVNLRPTLAGKVVLAAYRLHIVTIEMVLIDGRTVTHRFIPEMGENGFLLSPYVGSTDDFLRTAAGMNSNQVRKFRLMSDSRLWSQEMSVSFWLLKIPPEPTARDLITSPPQQ